MHHYNIHSHSHSDRGSTLATIAESNEPFPTHALQTGHNGAESAAMHPLEGN
jgi:hypothetical protein